ncbi:MAG: 3-hydroxybutyryl-CoA dehydrogenase [Schleiferiaceae bacterium]|jgi:3-hydroxybutyryl-CoA dehydrogenase|nr:3-hydroxybutyryl-CoA dehydrogenase [Schleiferiaceae bacterium]MDP4627266.1 3-hydroxybutyryl-CoA dehydrogenase [Schleiferiaceae bacterium]MDP4728568.1 3-hydroxybutyryl-CoA dehydrogenase [Schleiferiaceae bacterium]MDP4749844.1 3-hydroxybutyryl-CoA dehydrogenase [Schleiferiaceae bacterium]MDP4901451.1 3-hydroxybutyryl-CoA dehydrogenase [Schleiferiaceae bacterium]
MKNAAVLGAGTMGNGIAHVFAQSGYQVALFDVSEAALTRAVATIEKNLERQVAKGTLSAADKDAALARIQTGTSLEAAVSQADLVVEAATENEAIKMKIFEDLDRLAPAHCILASNTSSLSITRIAAATQRPEQVIGMHFMNPVPVMKLVEIIRGFKTSDATTDAVIRISESLGKIAISCNDYPGFVANRILMPMINEAIESLHTGVAGVAEIDGIMKLGMAHPMGPLQLADFIGLDVCLSILRVLHSGLGQPKYAPNPLLVNMVQAGLLGVKSGQGFYNYAAGTKDAPVNSYFK